MPFSILSWNVENFDGEDAQLKEVSKRIKTFDPAVFGLFEVSNLNIINLMLEKLPDYNYNLTDGPENKEILVGVKKGEFTQSIFTQKREFKAYNPRLRPGALLTLIHNDIPYNVLFLHNDSGTEARDFGNRFEMIEKIWSLRNALNKKMENNETARLIVLGDLNTMGLFYPYRRLAHERVTEVEEIEALREYAARRNMILLTKEHDTTFNNLRDRSNLDHIIASDNIAFENLGERTVDNVKFQVQVAGWQGLQGAELEHFVKNISDHCLLYCEVTA